MFIRHFNYRNPYAGGIAMNELFNNAVHFTTKNLIITLVIFSTSVAYAENTKDQNPNQNKNQNPDVTYNYGDWRDRGAARSDDPNWNASNQNSSNNEQNSYYYNSNDNNGSDYYQYNTNNNNNNNNNNQSNTKSNRGSFSSSNRGGIYFNR